MPENRTVPQMVADGIKADALGVARIMGRTNQQKKATPEEELLLWGTVADGWTIEQELSLLDQGKTREEVGLLKYPHRQQMIEDGERALDKSQQYAYAAHMAQKADPTWQPLPKPDALHPALEAAQSAPEPASGPSLLVPTPSPAAPIAPPPPSTPFLGG